MGVTVIVLGTAQDGGYPQMGSPARGPDRLVSSLAAVLDDGTTLLADVTPDVRAQTAVLGHSSPYRHRHARNVVDHITLTHGHMGHYTGLVQFGKEAHNAEAIPAWVTPAMARFLQENQPWQALVEDGHLDLRPGWGERDLAPGLRLRLLPVPHRAEFTDTVAISINNEVLFVPDIDAWEGWAAAEEEIADHRVVLLDATFWSSDEVPGRNLADIPHPLVPETLERFRHLSAGRRLLLTHFNHTNPLVLPESSARDAVRAAGFEVAEDFMTFRIGE